jgi:hypothetical protein
MACPIAPLAVLSSQLRGVPGSVRTVYRPEGNRPKYTNLQQVESCAQDRWECQQMRQFG